MKRRLPGEERREFQKWSSGHNQGFVYGPDADYALELALRIIEGDEAAWEILNQRPDLLTNVASDLRSEGARSLADQVENMNLDLKEHRYIKTQEKTMRIRGSELKKIIKEELRRSMLREGDEEADTQTVTLKKGQIDRKDRPMSTDNAAAVSEIQKMLGLRATGKWEPELDMALWGWMANNADKMNIEGLDNKILSDFNAWQWDEIAPKITRVNMKTVSYSPNAAGLLKFMKDLQTAYPDVTKLWAKGDFDYK